VAAALTAKTRVCAANATRRRTTNGQQPRVAYGRRDSNVAFGFWALFDGGSTYSLDVTFGCCWRFSAVSQHLNY